MNFIHELKEAAMNLLILFPGEMGYRIRYRYYQGNLKNCGFNVIISKGVVISSPQSISLGDYVRINQDCHIRGEGKINIGAYTMIAMNVIIITSNHTHIVGNIPFSLQGETHKPITIGSNCWIGANSIILPGVRIGDNCVIAAGSIVSHDVPNNTVFIQKR